jgi:hypothetical protein
LLEQAIDERRLAVINVGDDSDVAYMLHKKMLCQTGQYSRKRELARRGPTSAGLQLQPPIWNQAGECDS